MSNTDTIRMIDAYNQSAEPTLFFTSMFQSPETNFYSSKQVQIDIQRTDEDISIAIQDLTTGYRYNSKDVYTNKEFVAPIHSEAVPIDSFSLLDRMPGRNPFQDPEFRADVILRMFQGMRDIEKKIRRSIELQSSQVLQTGIVTLTDSTGATIYTIDYKPKANHFPVAGTAWNAGGATPLDDIGSLADIIRNDGLTAPDQLIMGDKSFNAFIANDDVQKHFDNRRIDQGTISGFTEVTGGGNFRGVVAIGSYQYDILTYSGRFKDPQTGAKLKFLSDDKVIVRVGGARLDATFGAIPNIGRELGIGIAQQVPELPTRISNAAGRMDLFTNVWVTVDGAQLFGSVAARPLMIPTAIDTYGAIDTGV